MRAWRRLPQRPPPTPPSQPSPAAAAQQTGEESSSARTWPPRGTLTLRALRVGSLLTFPPLLLCAARLLNSRAQITVLRDPSLDLLLQSPWPWLVAGALIRVWTGGRQEPGPIGSLLSALLLSPRSQVEPSSEIQCSGWCLITTLTQVTTSGQELGRITGVTAIYPGGWVLRYASPQEAAALAEREAPVPSRERGPFIDTWATLSQDVTDIDSGASADVTGMGVKPHRVPTGPGLLATRPGERTGEGRVRAEPVFSLSATDDGAPHPEGLEAFEE